MQYLYLDTSEMKHVHWPVHSIEGIRIDLVDGFYRIKILRLVRMYGGMEYIWYQDTSTASPLYAACLVTCKLHVNNYDCPTIWEHAREAANRYIKWENVRDLVSTSKSGIQSLTHRRQFGSSFDDLLEDDPIWNAISGYKEEDE